jgi:hypothetical protein
MLPIAGGAGLALLGLIGVGLAMRRRRRRNEDELAAARQDALAAEAPAQAPVLAIPDPLFAEPAFVPPVVEPAPALAPAPAVAMAASAAAAPAAAEFLPEGAEAAPAAAATVAEPALEGPCADAAPGSHVEAACEGPTEDNPSLSIKKRIKRAQFFDQREQLVAAGMAVPVESDAGLPDAAETPEPVPSTTEPAQPSSQPESSTVRPERQDA